MTTRSRLPVSSFCALLPLTLLLTSCIGVTRSPSPSTIPANEPGALDVYAVGDIADCRRDPPAETMAARTARLVPEGAHVLGLGDMVYHRADAATLASCYEPTWGRHRGNTLVTPGNHDLVDDSPAAFVAYFGLPAPHADGFMAFSRPLNDQWLLISLDSNVTGEALEAQYQWLQRTLAQEWDTQSRDAQRCLLVMWHAPLFSSGWHRGSGDHMRRFWQLLDQHGADVVLGGHEHFYERFGPLDAGGNPPDDGHAPRQFVVGTGGAKLYGFWKPPYRSEARVLQHGVLRLSLESGGYSWRFVDVDHSVRDAGVARCHATSN